MKYKKILFQFAIITSMVVTTITASVLGAINVQNFTETQTQVEKGMEIFKYETESMAMLTSESDFDSQNYTQNQFQAATPDLDAVADTDDYLALNHYGDNPPDTSLIDWWDDDSDSSTKYNWRYRKCLTLDHTALGAQNQTEYQVYLDFDTQALISAGKMAPNGEDIRILDSDENLMDFYIADDINTTSTRIWVQMDNIQAAQTEEVCLYYGYKPYLDNPIPGNLPAALSNQENTFTYSSPEDIYYVVADTAQGGMSEFSSYYDSNQVSVATYSQTLSQYQSDKYPATALDQTSAIYTTDPINAGYNINGTDNIQPASFAGTSFTYRFDRGTNEFSFLSPFCSADVEVRNQNNTIVTGGSFTITQGSFQNLTTDNTNGTGIPNATGSAIIEVTNGCPILAYHTAGTNDSHPLIPAAEEWYGVGTQNVHISALQNGTNVTIYRNDGSTTALVLNRGQTTTFGGAAEGATFSHRVVADQPIGVKSQADSDGNEAASFLPVQELGFTYYIPQDTQYISVAALQNTTGTVELYNDGTACGVGPPDATQAIAGAVNLPGFGYFGSTTDGTNIAAGSCIISDIPIAAMYEYSSFDDEQNLWNYKQNRQFIYQEPTTSFGSVEQGVWTLGSATHEWTRRISVTVANNATSTINEYQVPIDISSITDIFNLSQANGGDIRVAGSIGDGTDDETYFLDLYDSTGNTGLVWVKTGSIAAAANQTFYIYFRAIDDFNTLSLSPDIWLDGIDIDGDGSSGNNPTGNLSTWEDKSGNNNDATQVTVARQPVINGNIIEFTGNSDATETGEYLDIPNIDLQTFFIVFDDVQDSGATGGGIHAVTGVQGGIYMFISTNELGYQVSFDGQTTEEGSFNLNNGAVVGPGENIGTGNFPAGQQVFWAEYQNSQAGWDYVGALDFGGVTAGYNPTFDIKEFIALDGTVTALERGDMNTYLIDKWGTTQATTTLSTTGNIQQIFTTTNLYPNYYVVEDAHTSGVLTLISFADGNQVSDNIDTTTVDEGEIESYPFSTPLTQTDVFSVTAPLSISFADDTTDSAIPISFAGTNFVYNNERNSDVYSFYSPFQDAAVQIQESSGGTWTTVQNVNVPAGTALTVSDNAPDNGGFQIISDVPILAFHRNDTNDSKVMYPTELGLEEDSGQYELYGVGSSNIVIAASNSGTTNVTLYRSNGTSTAIALNSGNNYTYTEAGGGTQGTARAYHLVADGPIGATSYADADGGETASFLSQKEFSDIYLLPEDTQYLSVATKDPSVTCRVYDDLGAEITTGPASMDNVPPQTSGAQLDPFPNNIHIGGDDTGDGSFFGAGYTMQCTEPVYAYFERHEDTAKTDETTLLTIPQGRQRAEVQPVIEDPDLSPEQGLYFESGFDSATTALDPEAQLEWIIDTSSLLNSEHIFWDQIDWTEIYSDRTQENSVDSFEVELAYADPTPSCAAATYTTLVSSQINVSSTPDPSPPFSDETTDINQIQIPDTASDHQCLKVSVTIRTGDEAYTPRIPEISAKYRIPTILEDQLNSPLVTIQGSTTDNRVRIIKITNPNAGLTGSTCELAYNSVSNAAAFTNTDFEFYEHLTTSINSQFDFPAFPATPPSVLSGSSSVCDPTNDLSIYFEGSRTVGVTENINLTIQQNIQNLNGPLSTRDFQLDIASP